MYKTYEFAAPIRKVPDMNGAPCDLTREIAVCRAEENKSFLSDCLEGIVPSDVDETVEKNERLTKQ